MKKETKKPRKTKTVLELIPEMHRLEKRILNEIVKNPSSLKKIAEAYMKGYNKYTADQIGAYRRMANALQGR